MERSRTQEFEELSLAVFGNKYHYRKLMSQGIIIKSAGPSQRRQPLSEEGTLQYMKQTLEMRKKLIQDLQAGNNEQG